MAALLVGMGIMAVMLTVAMPVWSQLARREKEEELVFRGEQYARAIGLFQRKFANAAPPTIDLLVEQKFLRKKYKDPISGEDFVPVTQAQQAPQTSARPGETARTQVQPPPRPATGGGQAPGSQVGGIMGVTSKSTEQSIRLYKGRNHYNEWQFVYTPPAQAPGQQQPGQQPQTNNPGTNRGPQQGGQQPTRGPQTQPPAPARPGR